MSITVSRSRMSPLCRIFLVAMSLLCALHQSTIAENLKKLTHPTSFQFGQVELLDYNWTKVTFKQPLVNPVVFAGPTLIQQERAVEIQVTDITSGRFYIRVKKNCLDISSKLTNGTVSWFAASVGEYVTDDNRSVLVDTFTTYPGRTRHVVFSKVFPETPVLLSTIQYDTSNREKNIFTRRKYATKWFLAARQYTTDFRSGNVKSAYMAIEVGSGSMDGFKYAAYKRDMDRNNMITYEESNFTTGPLFLSTPTELYNFIGLSGFPKAKSAKVQYSYRCSHDNRSRTVEFFAIDGAYSTTTTTTHSITPKSNSNIISNTRHSTTITTTTTTPHSTTTTTSTTPHSTATIDIKYNWLLSLVKDIFSMKKMFHLKKH